MPGVQLEPPRGAFYLFPDIAGCLGSRRNGVPIASDMDLASYLMEEAKVAVVPGTAFGSANHLRLSYACSMKEITGAADRIESALKKLLND